MTKWCQRLMCASTCLPDQDLGQETGGLERALLPLSSLAGWGLITTVRPPAPQPAHTASLHACRAAQSRKTYTGDSASPGLFA